MTFEQAAILLLLAGMLVVFALDRVRMEVVALVGLTAGFALGLVPADAVVAGFADPTVLTVIEILLIVQVLGRSRLFDQMAQRIAAARLGGMASLLVLCALSAGLSAFMNNIGALALMIPVVYGVCSAGTLQPRVAFMAVSFAALLGGTGSIIGTPANLVVSRHLEAATGAGFGFFDIGWAGLPAMLAGIAAIVFWLPRQLDQGEGGAPAAPAGATKRLVCELRVGPDAALAGWTMAELPFQVYGGERNGKRLFLQRRDLRIEPGDVLLIDAPTDAVAALVEGGALSWPHQAGAADTRLEAVVMPESTIVGSRVGAIGAFVASGVRVVAVAPRTHRIEGALVDLQLSIGDVLVLQGGHAAIAEAIAETDMLALETAHAPAPPRAQAGVPLMFVAGILLTAFDILPPHLAFGLVVILLAAAGTLNLRTALADLNWPILIMLAAMIPLGGAVATTGLADSLAHAIIGLVPPHQAEVVLVGVMLGLGVVLTPFVNNASTAIVLAPVAMAVAASTGMAPEPLLIAVALGASLDFLTPFGHHNNTLAMGLAGYRFADFARAGWPVTVAATLAGYGAILLWW